MENSSVDGNFCIGCASGKVLSVSPIVSRVSACVGEVLSAIPRPVALLADLISDRMCQGNRSDYNWITLGKLGVKVMLNCHKHALFPNLFLYEHEHKINVCTGSILATVTELEPMRFLLW